MRPNHLKAIATLFALLAVTACGSNDDDDYTPITDKDFKTGTDGLALEFIDSAPPVKIGEESQFPIAAMVRNKGAYDITEGYLTVSVENDYMGIFSTGGFAEYTAEDKAKLSQAASKRMELDQYKAALIDLQSQYDRLYETLLAQDFSKATEDDEAKLDDLSNQINQKQYEISTLEQDLESIEKGVGESTGQYLTQGYNGLKGRTLAFPEGQFKDINYEAKTKKVDAQSEQHRSTILLTACYQYYTEFGEDVCIDPDLYNTKEGKVCKPDKQGFSSQGAPIAVTELETKMIPVGSDKVKPLFIITIKNKGDGNVVRPDKVKQACSAFGIGRFDWNMVELAELRLQYKDYKYEYGSSGDFKCRRGAGALDENKVLAKLEKDEAVIYCELEDRHAMPKTDPAFTTLLYIKLRYGYTLTEAKEIIIENPRAY